MVQLPIASNKRFPILGFMQGRLVEPVNGLIQAFPQSNWRSEFGLANSLGLSLMEWTLDHDRLCDNPLMLASGRSEIKGLSKKYGVEVASVTGDCFMQAPFWKSRSRKVRSRLLKEFSEVVSASTSLGVRVLVVPLVDNGTITNSAQEKILLEAVHNVVNDLGVGRLKVAFESDYDAGSLARFIAKFDPRVAGVNYDIGNSAASGFSASEEIRRYGHRVINVHVKDRRFQGATCALGTGNANFGEVFSALRQANYSGNYILQTARAEDGEHIKALHRYATFTEDLLRDV